MKESTKYNIKQLILPTIFLVLIVIYDFFVLFNFDMGRDMKSYLSDIRKINDYSKEFLAFTSLLVALLVGLRAVDDADPKTWIPVMPFFVALAAASFNIIFLPVPYKDNLEPIHALWVSRVVAEQATVIYSFFGVYGLLRAFMKMKPIK